MEIYCDSIEIIFYLLLKNLEFSIFLFLFGEEDWL